MRFDGGVDDSRRLLQVGVVGVPDVVGGHHVVHFGREHCLGGEHRGGGGLVLADDCCYVVLGVRLVRVQSVGVVQLQKEWKLNRFLDARLVSDHIGTHIWGQFRIN